MPEGALRPGQSRGPEVAAVVVADAGAPADGDGKDSSPLLPSAEALGALCDAADAGAVSPPPPQISQDLRRSLVSPRVMKKGSK